MANKVLKKNNQARNAARPATKKAVATVSTKDVKAMPKADYDYSTIREASNKNADPNLVTYFVYDNHTETDVCFCEHKDYLSPEVRAALKAEGII